MKDGTRKQVLDTFSKHLLDKFSHHCTVQGYDHSLDKFATYIVDRGLISNTAVQKYAILHTFEELKQQTELTKTELVHLLADRFNLTTRSIWNVLRSHRTP